MFIPWLLFLVDFCHHIKLFKKMKTLTIFIFLMGTLAFGGMANAGYLSKCAVVRSLRRYNVPESEMRDCKSITRNAAVSQYLGRLGGEGP